jgi:hypothetical protein
MANAQTRRISPSFLTSDRQAHDALQSMADYTPANAAYKLTTLTATRQNMEDKQRAETQAAAAAALARDEAVAAEWEFHNAILGAKEQVIAQYGKDSGNVQSLGLKRKSEYKAPTRKAKPTDKP